MSTLIINGAVEQPAELTFEQLAAFPEAYQIRDVSRFDPKRQGDAISLRGLLALVRPQAQANYLGLHAEQDDFHASVPLAPILERAFLIYRVNNAPLAVQQGGPFRFFIPDFAACHTHEIDECANVKYVNRMELTTSMGFDNRPHDAQQHADLHAKESPQ
jgi:DMSO/TMAO reductase YedYZ molybdopterin-dependent catalytic subunit